MESVTSEQEFYLLADTSQVSMATAEVQAGTLPQMIPQGIIFPSPLVLPNYSMNN